MAVAAAAQPATPAPPESELAPPPGEHGLTSDEAGALLAAHGPNLLVPERRRSGPLAALLRPLADPMVLLLVVATVTYLALREYVDALITLVAIAPIVAVGVALEARAERALEQLRRLTTPVARTWRDGARHDIATDALVPGDLVLLHEGDIVPADGELLAGAQLSADESALTGESVPATKDAAGPPEDRAVYAGTTVLAGRGFARLTATGPRTRYGRIGSLVADVKPPPTPLERLIRRLVRQLGLAALVVCLLVALLELARGGGWAAALIAGVSLAIAAVPEEFPLVYTLYLTLGAWRLARDRALVRRLAAVETLGGTTVICADKTGTLTLGQLAVGALATADGTVRAGDGPDPAARALLEAAVLASEPRPFDPLEQAILRFAAGRGVDVAALHGGAFVRDYPFDPAGKYMAHVWRRGDALAIYAKGATEGILARSAADEALRRRLQRATHELADEGMRVIAVAAGALPGASGGREEDERHLRALGLVAFSDPLRPGVAEALAACRAAGIRVIMITGDHPVTAHAVAEGLGLPHPGASPVATGADLDAADDRALADLAGRVNIFARTRPEQKHRLVRALRARGEVVAMTGDGINDAPALREADIGVAMGRRGTEVARAAAALVLLDDNFATIVHAVHDGRRIFANLQRAFAYLIAFHAPVVLAALIIPLTGAPLLLLPVHLVALEVLLHPVVALVFDGEAPAPDLMRRPPRPPGTALVARAGLLRPLAEGAALFGGVLALFLTALGAGTPEDEARALAFAALILGQVALLLAERAPDAPVWRAGLGGNRALPVILVAVLAALLGAVAVPPLAALVRLAPLSPAEWGLAAAVAAATLAWAELLKAAGREPRPRR